MPLDQTTFPAASWKRCRIAVAEEAHVDDLAGRLRAEDIAECEALGLTGRDALEKSFRGSVMARTIFVDDIVAAMYGVGGPMFGVVGHPWLLTAMEVERIPRTLIRHGFVAVGTMHAAFPELRGVVDARYTGAVRMLKMLGFSVGEPKRRGWGGVPFHEYSMKRGD